MFVLIADPATYVLPKGGSYGEFFPILSGPDYKNRLKNPLVVAAKGGSFLPAAHIVTVAPAAKDPKIKQLGEPLLFRVKGGKVRQGVFIISHHAASKGAIVDIIDVTDVKPAVPVPRRDRKKPKPVPKGTSA